MVSGNRTSVAAVIACLSTFGTVWGDIRMKPVEKGQRVFTAGHITHDMRTAVRELSVLTEEQEGLSE